VALGSPETRASFEGRFVEAFGKPQAPPRRDPSMLEKFVRLMSPFGRSTGTIIYFDERGRPYEEPLVYRITWLGLALSPYRPYRDSLQAAFENVFAMLALPWQTKRSQTTAVLLALFGGLFGLHHFYAGHTRRGLWYLAFFWLAFPIVLGWIDAVQLALLNDVEFQARLKTCTTQTGLRRSQPVITPSR
jgi:TM2 domain-containing membrane protein YozV